MLSTVSDADLPFSRIPEPPEQVRGATVLGRLVEGLAFRYRWATESLPDGIADHRPGPQSMTLLELLQHIERLVAWVDRHLGGVPEPAPEAHLAELRRVTLGRLASLAGRLRTMPDTTLAASRLEHREGAEPFWSMINGPLADALTHVGQVNAWRRLAGAPAPQARMFRGLPPD
jgi:hypothetical protein